MGCAREDVTSDIEGLITICIAKLLLNLMNIVSPRISFHLSPIYSSKNFIHIYEEFKLNYIFTIGLVNKA